MAHRFKGVAFPAPRADEPELADARRRAGTDTALEVADIAVEDDAPSKPGHSLR
jgi:hypothetical protein